MPRIAIVDTYYPEFLATLKIDPKDSYDRALKATLELAFGTSDFYSRNLRGLGWEAIDIVANYPKLQALWAIENGFAQQQELRSVLFRQLEVFDPDVVFMQDLSFLTVDQLIELANRGHVLAGQCSCPMPNIQKVKKFDVLFTSFPHYLEQFSELSVDNVLLPLAFDPSVIARSEVAPKGIRAIDCAFIGGVGNPSHWEYGLDVLTCVAQRVPSSRFYGYGYNTLPEKHPVRKRFCGPAWGNAMYSILVQSKIVINRHGEVADRYANNLRMFEATGCGALLITENKDNIRDYFASNEIVTYETPADAADKVRYYLDHDDERQEIAWRGHLRTLGFHTYAQRMPFVSAFLHGLIDKRKKKMGPV